MQLQKQSSVEGRESRAGRPALALIALIPLVWLLAVTFTAGVEKIFHPDPRIGFIAAAKEAGEKDLSLKQAESKAYSEAFKKALASLDIKNPDSFSNLKKFENSWRENKVYKAIVINRAVCFNNLLDAGVSSTFLILVSIIVLISVREWILLLSRRKQAVLHETEPVWLPDYAVAEGNPLRVAGAAALALTLAKELSGESQLERARQQATVVCECSHHEHVAAKSDKQLYDEVTKERFTGVRRCC
jgi:hypothetical protein